MDDLAGGIARMDTRGKIAIMIIFAYIATEAGMIGISLAIMAGAIVPVIGSQTMETLSFCQLTNLLFYLGSAVAVGFWIHRAHANLFTAGLDGLEFTPGWSIGWFFVPIMSLFKPFQAMRELANRSLGEADSYGTETPPDLAIWWGCFLAGNVLANFTATAFEMTTNGITAGLTFGMLASALMIVSAWKLKAIIEKIGTGQRAMLGIARTFD